MPSRIPPLPRTFAQLFDPKIAELDLQSLLEHLSSFYLQLFDVVSSGVLFQRDGALELLYASDDAFEALERGQLDTRRGPSLDAFAADTSLELADLSQAHDWPDFHELTSTSDFQSFYVFPLRFRGVIVGTLDLAAAECASLSTSDRALGQALADVLAVAIIQNFAVREADSTNGHLQRALTCRIAIEQAKGILAERHRLDMDTAFTALRRYARDTNQQLGVVSSAVVNGTLSLDFPSGSGANATI